MWAGGLSRMRKQGLQAQPSAGTFAPEAEA